MIPSLPAETIDHIVAYAHASPETLSALALASKSFLPASRYHLFRSLVITTQRQDKLISLIDTIMSPHQTFLPFVSSVLVYGLIKSKLADSDAVVRVLRLLSNTETRPTHMTLRMIDWRMSGPLTDTNSMTAFDAYMAFLHGFTTITSLALDTLFFDSDAQFGAFLASFPHLRDLSLATVVCRDYNRTGSEESRTGYGLIPRLKNLAVGTSSSRAFMASIGMGDVKLEEFTLLSETLDLAQFLSGSKDTLKVFRTRNVKALFDCGTIQTILSRHHNLLELDILVTQYPNSLHDIIELINAAPDNLQIITLDFSRRLMMKGRHFWKELDSVLTVERFVCLSVVRVVVDSKSDVRALEVMLSGVGRMGKLMVVSTVS